jgi:hypothetical protein
LFFNGVARIGQWTGLTTRHSAKNQILFPLKSVADFVFFNPKSFPL